MWDTIKNKNNYNNKIINLLTNYPSHYVLQETVNKIQKPS